MHLALGTSDLRAQIQNVITATDATPSSGGSAEVVVPSALAAALYAASEQRGCHIRLDRPEHEQDSSRLIAPSEELSQIVSVLDWKATGAYKFRQTSHINLQEIRAWRREVQRLALGSGVARRQVFLNDSMVSVGCISKGRSSSFKVNGIMRATLGYSIFGRFAICAAVAGVKVQSG